MSLGFRTGLNLVSLVLVHRFGSEKWDVDPDCLGTPLTSCRPGSVRSVSRPGEDCVQLRVRAERAGSESEPVQACSRIGKCSRPEPEPSWKK